MSPEERIRELELEQELRRRKTTPPPAAPGILDRVKAKLDEGGRALAEARKQGAETEQDMLTAGARGVTFGLDDVVAGAGGALGAAAAGLGGFEAGDPGEAYDDAVKARRAKVAAAKERSPVAAPLAEVGGALATIPLGAAAQTTRGRALVGGATGALAALGLGDSDNMKDAAKDVFVGGAAGGTLGALAPLIGKGVEKVAGGARRVAEKVLGKAGSRADELRVLTTMGATGGTISNPAILKEVANVPGGVPALANTLRETGVSKGITTTSGIAKRAAEVEERSGAAIGRFIDEATDSGGYVDVTALTARLRAAAEGAGGAGKGVSDVATKEAKALAKLADRFDEAFPGGVAPVREAKNASVALADDAQAAYRARTAGKNVEGKGRALMEARRASEAGISDAIEGLGSDAAGYQRAKTQFQASRLAREAAETSLGRADKNNLLSLADATLASAGPGGALAALGRKAAGPFAASIRATMAEQAQAMAERLAASPDLAARLGAAVSELAPAASKGPAALAAAHARLLNTDKAYADAVKELEAQRARQQALEGMQ